ncbi:MAG: uroporphyrinogen decarboxylase family protein, partial [Nitrosospira sp.]
AVLFATPEVIVAEVEKILASYGNGCGHVFNLGHGISQFTPPESALTLVEAVHSISLKYR